MVAIRRKHERPVDVRSGHLYIRLAESEAEVRAAQRLRYRVFCEEMAAKPTPEVAAVGREFDRYDDYCDHLLVFDLSCGSGPRAVIGTYRFMRREAARRCGQFYTADEYDISPLLAYPGEIMELGRSCVDADYRSGSTMQILWRGIAEYVLHYDVQVMFGCASLHGTDPDRTGRGARLPLPPPPGAAGVAPPRTGRALCRHGPPAAGGHSARAGPRQAAAAHQGLPAPRRRASATAPSSTTSSTPRTSASWCRLIW